MEGNPKSCGVWAPCLSYSNGLFYLVYTDMKYWTNPYKDSPNYITTSKDIRGPWSDPVYINSSGFDPSLFHDDDGRMYFLNMEWDYRKNSGTDKYQFTGILLTELNPATFEQISEPVKIFDGTEKGMVEASHIYKKDGFYYLFTAEGGTVYEHAETVARSRNLAGPYELHPNTYLTCAENYPDSPIQKTGHGSLAQSGDGRWWYASLCGRPLDNKRCPLGRETSINEAIWKDGWPYLKNGTILMDEYFEGYGEKQPESEKLYQFINGSDQSFALDFQSLRSKPKYAFTEKGLRLYGSFSPACNFGQALLARRQQHFRFEATTKVTLHGANFQQMAGLMYRYDEITYYFLRIAYDEKLNQKALGIICSAGGEFSIPLAGNEIPVGDVPVYLKVCANNETARFKYSMDGVSYKELDYNIDVSTLSDEFATPLGFTGAYIGMQCVDMRDRTAYADFEFFRYTPRS
jgi:xylan 1,4-beta-xylosidase